MGIKKSSQQLIFLTDPLGFRRASKTSHSKQANCLPQIDGKTNTVGFGSVFSQRTNTSFTRERFRHFFFLTQEQQGKNEWFGATLDPYRLCTEISDTFRQRTTAECLCGKWTALRKTTGVVYLPPSFSSKTQKRQYKFFSLLAAPILLNLSFPSLARK